MGLVEDQLEAAESALFAAATCLRTALTGLRMAQGASEGEGGRDTPSEEVEAVCAHTEALAAGVMGSPGRRYCPACGLTFGDKIEAEDDADGDASLD